MIVLPWCAQCKTLLRHEGMKSVLSMSYPSNSVRINGLRDLFKRASDSPMNHSVGSVNVSTV